MAVVSNGFYSVINLTDTAGRTATKRYKLIATSDAEALTAHTAVVSAVTAITKLALASHYWYEMQIENAPSLPTGASIRQKGIFTWQNKNVANKTATDEIPDPIEAVRVSATGPGNLQLNTSATELADYISLFNDATVPKVTISDGEQMSALIAGRVVSRGG